MRAEMHFQDFTNVHVYCFDLNQYSFNADKLEVTIFATYKDECYYVDDIHVDPLGIAEWNGYKWVFTDNGAADVLKLKALIDIYKAISVGKGKLI